MKVRQLDANGFFQFNRFYVNSPDAVAQKLRNRFALWRGEWFLDDLAGTPWLQQILGRHAGPAPPQPSEPNASTLYDFAIKEIIFGTPGVSELVSYSSNLDGATRVLTSVAGEVLTIYSAQPVPFNQTIQVPPSSSGLG